MNFGQRLKNLRKEAGLTQAELSEKLGISRSSESMYEHGDRRPSFELLDQIADFFDVDFSYLLGSTNLRGHYAQPDGYYSDHDTASTAQELFDQPGMRVLFDAAKDARPEDLQKAADFLKAAKAISLGLDGE